MFEKDDAVQKVKIWKKTCLQTDCLEFHFFHNFLSAKNYIYNKGDQWHMVILNIASVELTFLAIICSSIHETIINFTIWYCEILLKSSSINNLIKMMISTKFHNIILWNWWCIHGCLNLWSPKKLIQLMQYSK